MSPVPSRESAGSHAHQIDKRLRAHRARSVLVPTKGHFSPRAVTSALITRHPGDGTTTNTFSKTVFRGMNKDGHQMVLQVLQSDKLIHRFVYFTGRLLIAVGRDST
jgi:hypothetical protein